MGSGETVPALGRRAVSTSYRVPLLALCVTAMLALHAWSAVSATAEKSPTYDEPFHLTGGYSYWQYSDFRLHPENGMLPQRWAALWLLDDRPELPVAGAETWWARSDTPRLMDAFLYRSGNDTAELMQRARTASVLWSVLLGLMVFVWSRRLWGDAGGLFSLALFSVSATLLAHGPLVTSDVSAAFFLLAASGAYWKHLERLTPGTLALSALATGLAVVAKFSFLLLPFVFGAMALWRLVERAPWEARWGARTAVASGSGRKATWLAGSTLLHLLVAWLLVWTFFHWRYLPVGPGMPAMEQYYRTWEFTLPPAGLLRSLVESARAWQLLPEAFIHGFTYVLAASQERAAFLNGEYSATGWWWFFPYAFLIKTPLAELLAVGAAALAVGMRWSRAERHGRAAMILGDVRLVLPLAALLLVYGAFSVTSNLNIGHRHLLPIYAPLLILAGSVASARMRGKRRLAAVLLVGLALVESLSIRPHYLAFFNRLVGGPSQGWRHLVDSSLDWGQDLPGLSRWLASERRGGEPVFASLFGALDLESYGIDAHVLAPDAAFRARPWVELDAGLYAISATMLQDVYSAFRGTWTIELEQLYQTARRQVADRVAEGTLAPVVAPWDEWGPNFHTLDRLRFARLVNYLRLRTPDGVVGHSIFVFRLTETEVRTVVQGTAPEYVLLLEAAP
jgi:4-amino-4-deoxy-L-arabinose transferase-like glycosyltransferase